MKMILKSVLFLLALSCVTGTETGLRLLFPRQKQYIFDLKTNVSIGTEPKSEKASMWLMEGQLWVQAYDNYTKARLHLDISKKTVIGNVSGDNSTGNYYYHDLDGDRYLKEPWELDYQDNGFIKSIYVSEEPAWSVNLKRGISVNLQLTRNTGMGSSETYSMNEPCLDEICVMVYTVKGNTIKKYTSLRIPTTRSSYSWGSVPWTSEYPGRPFVDSISTAERLYELDNDKGMVNLDLKGTYLYKTHDHILSVNTDLSLSFKEVVPSANIEKLNLTQTTIQYVAGDFSDPTNGIANSTEFYLANKCYTILLKIARKGIDADNIVRNASLIHNLDFIELLNTMSQLKYESLIKLFNDLVLSTSYDMETSRNIFLEILPHVRSDACARFIKYLVLEEKEKVEDAALLSLIRKLPFNVATHSQRLLEELEVLTKLGLDFPQDIRHAGILSFATLMHKTMEASQVKQDFFDGVVVKYFRMYSDCPRYLDKMVWLQGLCNIGYSAEAYTRIVAADRSRSRHERLWAALAGSPKTEEPFMVLETTLPILTNDTEDIQLRIMALHMFLSSPHVRETDLVFVHNYISGCNSKHLQRFWYCTVNNIFANRDFTGYRISTMSQLKYESLIKLFNDLVLSTSYDMETSRNIFLEILPHVRSDACARFIKYLVLEEKEKVEDAALLSLIRKLPFNVATHSQRLLEELEVLTKLGLDFPQDIRHAGILSFATLMHKTMEASQVKQDFFDGVVVKYFRMYSDCPRYLDKMVWLQGLCNIGYSAEAYTRIVAADRSRSRHERLWAALAGSPKTEEPFMVLETTLPILTNDTEDIQLRIMALHMFLSSPHVRETDLVFVHNYISGCNSKHLQRFWYCTVNNIFANRDFTGYRISSFYIPFIINQVSNPNPLYWATNNYIISGQEEDGAPSLQVLTIGDDLGALPAFVGLRVFTGGRRPYKAAIYLIVEGVITNVHEYKEFYDINIKELNVEKLQEVLKGIKTWKRKKAEKLHIDVVVKIHDMTVYATHLNETRFKRWNEEDYKYLVDFLRFGSHINQQIVYYPFQTDVQIPTELGTPIRLQSTILSFTSIRGNLTAPSDEDITWRNDLHIRYQGTAVTTLSTAAPLVQTVHVARIQQSLVAHLPMKFNVSLSSADKSLVLTWPNPGDQQAGVAMHSRAEVSTDTNNDGYGFMLDTGEVQNKKDSIFFDCKRPMTGAEVINKLLASNTKHHDFFHSIQPSLVVLNGLVLFSSPPPGSCGVILQPTVSASDDVLEVRVHLETLSFVEDVLKAEMWFRLKYFGQGNPENVFMRVEADAKFERKKEGTTEYELTLHGHQPNATDPVKKEWRVRLTGQERLHTSFLKDISSEPVAYEGTMTLAFTGNQENLLVPDSELLVKYKGQPGLEEKKFVVKASGMNLSRTGFLESELISQTAWGQLLKAYSREPIDIAAVIKGNNGVSTLNINNATQVQLKSDSFSWLLDRWTDMQIKKNFGFYRECILKWPYIQTLSGDTSLQGTQDLILADCRDEKPRFAIISTANGIKVYNGGFSVLVDEQLNIDDSNAGDQFSVSKEGSHIKITLNQTKIVVYYQTDTKSILVPRMYTSTVCGACVDGYDTTMD